MNSNELKKYVDSAMTFAEYETLVDELLAVGKTTGTNQSEAMVGYGKLNRQRMSRLAKTVVIGDEIRQIAAENRRQMIWLVITEGWCGDSAQNVPVIEKIASESDKIETRHILRDENLELIDAFLTNGGRSIPKLVAIDATTYDVIFTWGPRPATAHDLYLKMKSDGTEKDVSLEQMQRWYNGDKGISVQYEFDKLIREANELSVEAAAK